MALVGALRAPPSNELFPSSEQSRDVQQMIMRVVMHPSRDWISAKGQSELGDGTIDFGGASDGLDGRDRLISSFTSAAKIVAVTHRQLVFWNWPSGTWQMRQVFVDRIELFIAHSSDWLPRHFLAEFMAVGINAGTHRGDELLKLPSLHKTKIGPERPKLSGHTTGQLGAVARTAILI